MKSLITVICVLGIIGILAVSQVRAGTESTVTSTVTVQSISVSITANDTVSYETLGQNSTKGTHSGDMNTTVEATNDGNITENFLIRALPDVSTPDWAIGGAAAEDVYVHMFCIATCTSPTTNYTALTTSNQSLATSIAKDGTQTFDLYINTPNPSTSFDQQSVNVIVVAESGA